MKCPICRKETRWQDNPYRPFCSERCKMIDLDHWLSERYRIPASPDTDDDSGATPAPGPEEKIV